MAGGGWAVSADAFEPSAGAGREAKGHYQGTLVWGPEKAERIVQLLDGREEAAEGPGSAAPGFGVLSSSAGGMLLQPGRQQEEEGEGEDKGQQKRTRVLLFCYSNRMHEIGQLPGAEQWCDYTIVPLLEVRPGERARDAWLRAERCAGYDVVGAAEAALACEGEAAARARWEGSTPEQVLQRGWLV